MRIRKYSTGALSTRQSAILEKWRVSVVAILTLCRIFFEYFANPWRPFAISGIKALNFAKAAAKILNCELLSADC